MAENLNIILQTWKNLEKTLVRHTILSIIIDYLSSEENNASNIIFVSDISGTNGNPNVAVKEKNDHSISGTELEETDFEVEEIIDKRVRKKKVEYCLKWKGYNDNENSWEPKENLNCDELIKNFEKNVNRPEMQKDQKKGGQGKRCKRKCTNSTNSTA